MVCNPGGSVNRKKPTLSTRVSPGVTTRRTTKHPRGIVTRRTDDGDGLGQHHLVAGVRVQVERRHEARHGRMGVHLNSRLESVPQSRATESGPTQPRVNRSRLSWTSQTSSSLVVVHVSAVPVCLGTSNVVMRKTSLRYDSSQLNPREGRTGRTRMPRRRPHVSIPRSVPGTASATNVSTRPSGKMTLLSSAPPSVLVRPWLATVASTSSILACCGVAGGRICCFGGRTGGYLTVRIDDGTA